MDYKAAVEALAEIERCFDVNTVLYDDIKIWPLVRLALWTQFNHPGLEFMNKVNSKRKVHTLEEWSISRIKAIFRFLKIPYHSLLYYRQLIRIQKTSPVDILFFSRSVEHSDKYNGKFYNRHIDPMVNLVREENSFLKLELDSSKAEATLPRFTPTHFFSSYLSPIKLLKSYIKPIRTNTIENFANLEQTILKITNIQLNEEYFINQANTILRFQAIFTDLLSTLKPKAVFLVCYYYPVAMALIRAGKHLGIKTVDVQHGKQGKYHGLYTHWTAIPENGYELLPDFFWNWGKESRDNIARWQPQNCHHHQPIVGGNRWLAKWIDDDEPDTGDEVEPFREHLQEVDKIILISLQPLDDPLPTHVLNAMRNSPDNWFWLIRLHPLQKGRQEQFKSILETHDITNFEINKTTKLPLYEVLKIATHHVTCFSSVCYEALAFNVPTIIVHPAGLQLYENYIDQGIFTYAQTESELINAISKPYSAKQLKEKEPYIETNREIAEDAIKIIMAESA